MKNIKIPELSDVRTQIINELRKAGKLTSKEEIKAIVDLAIRKNNEVFNAQIHKLKTDIGRLENK